MTALTVCVLLILSKWAPAQNLSAGDLAFIGYYRISASDAGFTFITLRTIPVNTVIYFTDRGVDGNAWISSTEGYLKWTVPANLVAGAIVHVVSQPGLSAVMRNGGSNVTITNSFEASTGGNLFSLSAGGDQVLAYQVSNSASSYPQPMNEVTFIAGIHTDYNVTKYNSTTKWSQRQTPTTALAGANESAVPPGLTNGVNCISVAPAFSAEYQYAKYKGNLTGTALVVRTAINTANNTDVTTSPWLLLPGASAPTPIGVSPGDFSANIALPVSYGTVSAAIHNDQLLVNWSTVSEQDNGYFVIELSGDGTSFIQAARVASKATNGKSNTLLHYQQQIDYKPGTGVLALSLAAILLAAGFRNRYLQGWMRMVLLAFLFTGMSACTKNGLQSEDNARLFVRISQIDKDGKPGTLSKIVMAVKE